MTWSVRYDAADIGVIRVQLLSEAQREMCQPLIVISIIKLRVIKVEISIAREVIV